jgi:hypothetical protein
MVLLVNGDSHTAGSEIDYNEQQECKEKAWGKHLADKLNMDYCNLAKPGSSNQRIVNTTQDWIISNILLDKKYKPEDIHVMIMWSGFDRDQIYVQDMNQLVDIGISTDVTLFKTKMTKELGDYHRSKILLQDHFYSCFNALSMVYNFSNWLVSLNIKHTFINGLYHFYDMDYVNNEFTNHPSFEMYVRIITAFGEEKINKFLGFYDLSNVYYHHLLPKKEFDRSPFGHFREDAHIYWTELVYKFMTTKNVTKKLI